MTDTTANKDEALERLLSDIEGKSATTRMNLALYMCILMHKSHNIPESQDDFEKVYKAGMKAHRAAAGSSFLQHIIETAIRQGRTTIPLGYLARIAIQTEIETHKIVLAFNDAMELHCSSELRKKAEEKKEAAK